MKLKHAARVILIGAPGVGKGTQTERLLSRFPQLQSISTGDLLRNNVKQRTALGIQAETVMKAGGLVDDSVMLRLISNELRTRGWLSAPASAVMSAASEAVQDGQDITDEPPFSRPSDDPSASFILDGYPRTPVQATTLDSIIPINLAVSLVTPFSVILDRITSRWVHEPSGRVYNTGFNAPRTPGRDDITGEPLTQREDDNLEVYSRRLQRFKETSEPLLEHYAKKGVLVEVDGMSSDEISPKLFDEFEKMFVR